MITENTEIADLIAKLNNPREGLRVIAIGRLIQNGEAAVSPLLNALHSEHEAIREGAALVLANIGKPALPGLLQAAQSSIPEIAWRARWALSHMSAGACQWVASEHLANRNAAAGKVRVIRSVERLSQRKQIKGVRAWWVRFQNSMQCKLTAFVQNLFSNSDKAV